MPLGIKLFAWVFRSHGRSLWMEGMEFPLRCYRESKRVGEREKKAGEKEEKREEKIVRGKTGAETRDGKT